MLIDYEASEQVCKILESIERTEDARFSPTNRRLALADYYARQIVLVDLCIESHETRKAITITKAARLSSPHIDHPHGIDFIDEEVMIVVNRTGSVAVFKLPIVNSDSSEPELLAVLHVEDPLLLHSVGSISLLKKEDGLIEALVCSNYAHHVARLLIDPRADYKVARGELVLRKWLKLPDGISVSRDHKWIAVSNQDMQNVLLFRNTASLNEDSDPDGILRSVTCPHGVRFTANGDFLLVADASEPCVHVYGTNGSTWCGVRDPLLSFRTMSDEVYKRGRLSRKQGGPKGLDITNDAGILVTTCRNQTLAFFDLQRVLEEATYYCDPSADGDELTSERCVNNGHFQRVTSVARELELHERLREAEARALEAEARCKSMLTSTSWRITAPLRAVAAALRAH